MIRAVFFDTSDTLYHNPTFRVAFQKNKFKHLAEKLDVSPEAAEEKYNETREELKETMLHPSGVDIMATFGVDRLQNLAWVAEVDPKEFLTPDHTLDNMLRTLVSTYRLGIITNILERNVLAILDALQVDRQHFSYIVSADKVPKSKPNKEPFEKALELAGCTPEECVFVGDNLKKDIIPAKRMGMNTIWVAADAHEDEHADAHCATIYDVAKTLASLNNT